MNIKKKIFIIVISVFFLSYIVTNLLSYKNAFLFFNNYLKNDENIIYQEKEGNTIFIISYPENKGNRDTVCVRYLKRNGWGIGESKVYLNYNSDMLTIKSFLNNNYKTLLKDHKLLETYVSPAFGTLGCLEWYSNKSLLGTITTYTEVTFELKENVDISTIKENLKSTISVK